MADFSKVHDTYDHDPITFSTIPWTAPHAPEPRCAMWKRRDVSLYRSLVASQYVQPLESAHDFEHVYNTLTTVMLHAMRHVNASRPSLARSSHDVSHWTQVVKQLAKQAKRGSKSIYSRLTDTFLIAPPPRPTYPQGKSSTSSSEKTPE